MPVKLFLSHSPAFIDRSAPGTFRASASSSAIVSSAAEMVLPSGAVSTGMPLFGRGFDVDRVDPDAGASDRLEPVRARERLPRYARGTAHQHRVGLGDRASARSSPLSPGLFTSSKRGSSRSGASPSREIASATSTRNRAGLMTRAPR